MASFKYVASLDLGWSSEAVLMIALALTGLVCALSVLKSLHTKSVLLREGAALVPEEWGNLIRLLITENQAFNRSNLQTAADVNEKLLEQSQVANNLLHSFLDLQSALDLRDQEIERLRAGSDVKIFKRFLNRFIRVDKALVEMKLEMAGEENERNYRYLSKVMEDALEECGVEKFKPAVDSDYREAGDEVSDEVTEIPTSDPDKDFQIAEIKSPAYVILGEGKMTVVQPALVSIYRLQTAS